MKVRAIANGNIIDLPEGHGLITAGIYVPVEDGEQEPAPVVVPIAVAAPPTTSKPVAPIGAKDLPTAKRTPPKPKRK